MGVIAKGCQSQEILQDDAPHHVALCDREVSGRRAQGVHEALKRRAVFIHCFLCFVPLRWHDGAIVLANLCHYSGTDFPE